MYTVCPGKQKGFTWFQYSNYGWQVQIDPKIVNLLKGCLQRKPRKRTTAKAEPLEVEPTAFFVERSRCHESISTIVESIQILSDYE
jgi:serine/threonine protein kinase